MSDRDKFEAWADLYIGWNDPDLMRDNEDPESYLMNVTQHAWMAWQAARPKVFLDNEIESEIAKEVFEAMDREFAEDPVDGITVHAADWRTIVRYLIAMGEQSRTADMAGWKAVPIKPTEEMSKAGVRVLQKTNAWATGVFQAMVEAAPAPPERGES